MRIMMMTNTYLPHVGGVARSVDAFTEAYIAKGHEVRVIAPVFEGIATDKPYVIRVKAFQNFNGSDFSVIVPSDGFLQEQVEEFKPDVIHSHHPFLLGGAAQRLATINNLPLVFTHHTLYEEYTHYVPGDSLFMKRFVNALSTEYANMASTVIAPSESIRDLLLSRGVTSPIEVIPTGVKKAFFEAGSGQAFRNIMNIDRSAFVVGHVGRLAPEKNLPFVADAVARFLKKNSEAVFLLVGTGPSMPEIRNIFEKNGVSDRLITTGSLDQPFLTSAYKAIDVFAFASQSETQGMVLTEAMATRTPVVAVDANGVREVLADGINGKMLNKESSPAFIRALQYFHDMPRNELTQYKTRAYRTAKKLSLENCADKLLACYDTLLSDKQAAIVGEDDAWNSIITRLGAEWSMVANLASAAGKAITGNNRTTTGEEENHPA